MPRNHPLRGGVFQLIIGAPLVYKPMLYPLNLVGVVFAMRGGNHNFPEETDLFGDATTRGIRVGLLMLRHFLIYNEPNGGHDYNPYVALPDSICYQIDHHLRILLVSIDEAKMSTEIEHQEINQKIS